MYGASISGKRNTMLVDCRDGEINRRSNRRGARGNNRKPASTGGSGITPPWATDVRQILTPVFNINETPR